MKTLNEQVELYYKLCEAASKGMKSRRLHHIEAKMQAIRSLMGKVESTYVGVTSQRGFLGRMVNKVVDLNYALILDTLDDIEDDLLSLLDRIED